MKRDANLILAARMADIEPFHVMDVQDRAHELEAKGRRIIHMEIGQPDFPAPPAVAEAAIEAIRKRRLGYTASIGIPQLRQAISDYYRERIGVAVPPSRIVVTAGASGAFLLVLGALVDPGDEVLLPDPCYPCNRHFVRLFEGRPRTIPVDEGRHYQPTDADVRANWSRATRGARRVPGGHARRARGAPQGIPAPPRLHGAGSARAGISHPSHAAGGLLHLRRMRKLLRGQRGVRAAGARGSRSRDYPGARFRLEPPRGARALCLHALAGGPRGRGREHRTDAPRLARGSRVETGLILKQPAAVPAGAVRWSCARPGGRAGARPAAAAPARR